jgi:DNA-directed RNA polymerase subunit RPC12/RpoP
VDYIVEHRPFRGDVVKYRCPHCSDQLESPLSEAGSTQPCPSCYKKLVTPGIKEWQAAQALELKREQEEQRREIQKAAPKPQVQQVKIVRPPKVPDLVWYRQMFCNSCGYRWKSRRNTPPGKCANCGARNIVPIMQPRASWWWPNAEGCLITIVLLASLATAMIVSAFCRFVL